MPAEDVMAQGIQNLQLRCIAQQNSENQIVVLAIQLQLPTAYSLLHEEEYAYLCQRLRILDKLYLFNSRIDGVLVEQGPNAFMIFTTRKSVERETRGYQDFYLLQMLREASVVRVCMGIGYGRTANASKFNAYEGIKRARRHAGGGAYVVFGNNEVIGPLNGLRKGESGEDIDQRIYEIARQTGLSANAVHAVFRCVAQAQTNEFTSRELAAMCGIHVRTMDRMILKLCDAGYCEVAGEKLMGQYGRPSRILRFRPIWEP